MKHMKKLSALIALALMLGLFGSYDSSAVGISIKIDFGKRNAEGNCGPGRGICSITIGASLRAIPGNPAIQVISSDAALTSKSLTVKLPTAINEKGKNENGKYMISIVRPMMIDKETAKKFGVAAITILPGNYEVVNNTIAFNVRIVKLGTIGQGTKPSEEIK
jgi:hypothetical protein